MKIPKFTGQRWNKSEHDAKKAAKDKVKADSNPNAKDIAAALGWAPKP